MKTKKVIEFNKMVKDNTQPMYIFYLENHSYAKRQVGYVAYNEVNGKVQKAVFGKTKLVAIDKYINNKFGIVKN